MTDQRPMNIAPTLFLMLALCLGTSWSQAADKLSPDQVKARMKANLPAIDALKKTGQIGENNKGYLEPRAKLPEKETKLLKMENEDRKAVYQWLADRTRTPMEKVQALRAKQIRERSAPNLWLQATDGTWYQKKA